HQQYRRDISRGRRAPPRGRSHADVIGHWRRRGLRNARMGDPRPLTWDLGAVIKMQLIPPGPLAAVSAFALPIRSATTIDAQDAAQSIAAPELAAKGVWSASTIYAKDDIVTARGSAWISLKAGNKNKPPGQTAPSTATFWQLFARGFNPLGAWSSAT